MDWHMGSMTAAAAVSMTLGVVDIVSVPVGIWSPPAIEATGRAPEQVRPGEAVLVEWNVTKRSGCPAVTSRVWFGQDGFRLAEPFKPAILPANGVATLYRFETQIPLLAPDGGLDLGIIYEFQCPGAEPQQTMVGPVTMEVSRAAGPVLE